MLAQLSPGLNSGDYRDITFLPTFFGISLAVKMTVLKLKTLDQSYRGHIIDYQHFTKLIWSV